MARLYLIVWLALLLLTAATFALARAPLGAFALPVALLIAGSKATLVLLFFMHLAWTRGASRLALVTAIFFVALLAGFTVADLATRFPPALPPANS